MRRRENLAREQAVPGPISISDHHLIPSLHLDLDVPFDGEESRDLWQQVVLICCLLQVVIFMGRGGIYASHSFSFVCLLQDVISESGHVFVSLMPFFLPMCSRTRRKLGYKNAWTRCPMHLRKHTRMSGRPKRPPLDKPCEYPGDHVHRQHAITVYASSGQLAAQGLCKNV